MCLFKMVEKKPSDKLSIISIVQRKCQ
uniref:Uncharacterized protein n=2 Tax=Brugia TaxID=6278 RepID=A8PQU1_BRUMA